MSKRSTVYNNITSPELIDKINEENKFLMQEFLDYLKSIDRAKTTLFQYEAVLRIFFVWNLEYNNNKDFIKISKREFAKFQNHAINEWGWSPKRTRRVKSVISSLSNFIENIMDEEPGYENYRAVVRKIENPVNDVVREKTVFESDELQKLLDILVEKEKYMQACALSLAMNSGRRKAEIPRFKVSYFNEENVIFGSLYKTPEKVTTKGRGSKGKLLHLYTLKKPFDPYLKMWMDKRAELGLETEWLFPAKTAEGYIDEPMKIETLNSWAGTFSSYLGKDFYWHSLRHYFTTECVKSNLPSGVIQEIIGWSSADMIQVYSDLSSDDMIGQYFDENGIKNVEQKSLSDM